ncbi:MAG TPA: peptidoglycan editing factor PgeF [Acidiferrobacterales bacterium]
MSAPRDYLHADWPAPPWVHAVTTTRSGGVSAAPYASFNLGDHVGDDPAAVRVNRAALRADLGLPAEPLWLTQVHGTRIVDARRAAPGAEADGAVTPAPGIVCAVLTADCLPVFVCDRAGTRAALVHAGWRGLAAGAVERAVEALGLPGERLLAWLGPAIGPAAFEVGAEVRDAFVAHDRAAAADFHDGRDGRFRADLYGLARRRLAARGVTAVSGGRRCTHGEADRFFSFRRDGRCGRMASLIWLDPAP